MSLQRTENVRVVANDLEIYFKGFEVALKKKNVEDAVRYLESMIEEIDYNIEHLQPIRNDMIEMDNRKRYRKHNLESSFTYRAARRGAKKAITNGSPF